VLPRIVSDLGLAVTELDKAAWLVTAYLLGYTVAMPLLARATDVYGQRTLFVLCAAVFAAGSLWAALAASLWPLVGARALQAAGGGGMVPVALAAAAALYRGRARVLALGAITAAAEAGGVLGPLYGSLMLRAFGWRSVFWVNLPLTAVLVAVVRLPARRGTGGGLGRAALAAVALAALTVGLAGDLAWALRAPALLAAVALAAAAGVRRPAAPIAVNFFVGSALIVALVVVPVFANVVAHEDTAHGALTLLRLTAPIPVGAVVGALVPRLAPAGLVLAAGGFVWLGTSDGLPTFALLLAGLGFGLVLAPVAERALERARGREATAAAALTVARMVGMMVGLAALTTWGLGEFNRRAGRYPLPTTAAERTSYERHLTDAALYVFGRVYLVAAALCLAGAACAQVASRPVSVGGAGGAASSPGRRGRSR